LNTHPSLSAPADASAASINGVDPKTRKILQLLRLRQIHNGVFLRFNKATLNMLRAVNTYVTYGTPNVKAVRELVYKRGFANVNKQRIAITDNSVIQKQLGSDSVICTEDIVHELMTCGKNFGKVSKFLWPFKLNSPSGGFSKKRISFIEGGQCVCPPFCLPRSFFVTLCV
jgi:large subunit ribosomal protein L7e